jgi:hypothetical protein
MLGGITTFGDYNTLSIYRFFIIVFDQSGREHLTGGSALTAVLVLHGSLSVQPLRVFH